MMPERNSGLGLLPCLWRYLPRPGPLGLGRDIFIFAMYYENKYLTRYGVRRIEKLVGEANVQARVKAIRLCLPMETYELLQQAAAEGGVSEELFAEICIASVISKYAVEAPSITEKSDSPHDVGDQLVVAGDDGGDKGV